MANFGVSAAKLSLFVTGVEFHSNLCLFWAQPDVKNASNLETIMADFANRKNQQIFKSPVEIGMFCWAIFEEDSKWYRGRVTSVDKESGKASVMFIDYGNTEKVSFDNLRILEGSDLDIPAQARRYFLADIQAGNGSKWKDSECLKIKEKLEYGEFVGDVLFETLHFYGQPGDTVRLHDVEANSPVVVSLLERGAGKTYDNDHMSSWPLIEMLALDTGKEYDIFLPFFDNPMYLAVHLADFADKLEEVQSMCDRCDLSQIPQLDPVFPGRLCLAKSDLDQVLYRAVVKEVLADNQCIVAFIDYGNSEIKNNCDVYCMPGGLHGTPSLSVHCVVFCDNSCRQAMEEAAESENLICKVNRKFDEKLYIVVISDELTGKSFGERKEVKATKSSSSQSQSNTSAIQTWASRNSTDLKIGNIYDACICHVDEQDNGFYIHLLENADDLLEITQALKNVERTVNTLQPEAGQCACLVTADNGILYRGKLLQIENDVALVHCIDFGHFVTVPLFSLHEAKNVPNYPSQAIACQFPAETESTSVNLHELESQRLVYVKILAFNKGFYDVLVLDSKIESTSEIKKPVQRTKQKTSVPPPDVKTGSIETLYVTAVPSGCEIFGQFSRYSADDLDQMSVMLTQFYNSQGSSVAALIDPRPGDYCCARFSDDNLWYRAVVTAVKAHLVVIRFLDYGNSEEKSCNDLKVNICLNLSRLSVVFSISVYLSLLNVLYQCLDIFGPKKKQKYF